MKCEQEQQLLAQVRPYTPVPVDTMQRQKKKLFSLQCVCWGDVYCVDVLCPDTRKKVRESPSQVQELIRGEGPSKGSDGQSDPMIF